MKTFMKTGRNCIALFLTVVILISMVGCTQSSTKDAVNTEESKEIAETEKEQESSADVKLLLSSAVSFVQDVKLLLAKLFCRW